MAIPMSLVMNLAQGVLQQATSARAAAPPIQCAPPRPPVAPAPAHQDMFKKTAAAAKAAHGSQGDGKGHGVFADMYGDSELEG
jgi:hypothetical protein